MIARTIFFATMLVAQLPLASAQTLATPGAAAPGLTTTPGLATPGGLPGTIPPPAALTQPSAGNPAMGVQNCGNGTLGTFSSPCIGNSAGSAASVAGTTPNTATPGTAIGLSPRSSPTSPGVLGAIPSAPGVLGGSSGTPDMAGVPGICVPGSAVNPC